MDKSPSQPSQSNKANNGDDSGEQAKQIGKWAVPAVGIVAAAAVCPPVVIAMGCIYGLMKLSSLGGGDSGPRIGPDGRLTSLGCAHCGSPVSAGHPVCANCQREWFPKNRLS
jgi:hypothetical protein